MKLFSSGKSLSYFEGVRVINLALPAFKNGAAMTIPGIGIFTGPGAIQDPNLLKHEFGHILQYRKWGAKMFWTSVAPSSLLYANYASQNPHYSYLDYMSNWTEWTANYLAYQYFNGDFNISQYPIEPVNSGKNIVQYPKFVKGMDDFYRKWLN